MQGPGATSHVPETSAVIAVCFAVCAMPSAAGRQSPRPQPMGFSSERKPPRCPCRSGVPDGASQCATRMVAHASRALCPAAGVVSSQGWESVFSTSGLPSRRGSLSAPPFLCLRLASGLIVFPRGLVPSCRAGYPKGRPPRRRQGACASSVQLTTGPCAGSGISGPLSVGSSYMQRQMPRAVPGPHRTSCPVAACFCLCLTALARAKSMPEPGSRKLVFCSGICPCVNAGLFLRKVGPV